MLLAAAVAIAYFSHAVTAQQAVFVYISFHAIDASFLGVLPGKDVSSVAQLGHMSIVLGYPKQVAVYSCFFYTYDAADEEESGGLGW